MSKFEEIVERFGGVKLQKAVWKDKEFYLVPKEVLEDEVEAIDYLRYLWISDPGTAAYLDKEANRLIWELLTGRLVRED